MSDARLHFVNDLRSNVSDQATQSVKVEEEILSPSGNKNFCDQENSYKKEVGNVYITCMHSIKGGKTCL